MRIPGFISVTAAVFAVVSAFSGTLVQAGTLMQTGVMQAARQLEHGVFSDCQFSMMAMWEDGEMIAGVSQDRKMNPASNLKAVTTGAALCALGGDYVWTTRLAYSGTLDADGVLDGDLYITGGGDPLLCSEVKGTPGREHVFREWLNLLRRAGISSVKGRIVGDGSRLEGMREDPSWEYGDLGTYYGTCLSALNFYENRQDFSAVPGKEPDAAASVVPTFPQTPWMKWQYACTTGRRGSGDKLYLYFTDGGNTGIMRGTIAVDRGHKTVMCRNPFPEYTLANEFCKYLAAADFPVGGGPAGLPLQPAAAPAFRPATASAQPVSITYIGGTTSMPLSFVVAHTNEHSDNLCAELLFRSVGRAKEGASDIGASRAAVISVLRDSLRLDASPSKIMISDGSGLSSHNFVSASFMCSFLSRMLSTPYADTFVNSLPPIMDGRVRVKTGSFNGCRTLCGYVLPADADTKRKIVFSIMVNASHLGMWTMDRAEKKVLSELVKL